VNEKTQRAASVLCEDIFCSFIFGLLYPLATRRIAPRATARARSASRQAGSSHAVPPTNDEAPRRRPGRDRRARAGTPRTRTIMIIIDLANIHRSHAGVVRKRLLAIDGERCHSLELYVL
jgi:hypothetical protein